MKSKMVFRYDDGAGTRLMVWIGAALAAFAAAGPVAASGPDMPAPTMDLSPAVPGVTFADTRGTLYAPARALGAALGVPVAWDARTHSLSFDGRQLAPSASRALYDGTQMVSIRDAADSLPGASLRWDAADRTARLVAGGRSVRVARGEKRVYVSLDDQRLRALQGSFLVLDTHVSTGRRGYETPTGRFTAGPLKAPLLISHKYHDARMPWSVQVDGDVVIHGYTSVPRHAASHGCVRVPLTGYNPAHYFYRWVDIGTPITIAARWPEPARGVAPVRQVRAPVQKIGDTRRSRPHAVS